MYAVKTGGKLHTTQISGSVTHNQQSETHGVLGSTLDSVHSCAMDGPGMGGSTRIGIMSRSLIPPRVSSGLVPGIGSMDPLGKRLKWSPG